MEAILSFPTKDDLFPKGLGAQGLGVLGFMVFWGLGFRFFLCFGVLGLGKVHSVASGSALLLQAWQGIIISISDVRFCTRILSGIRCLERSKDKASLKCVS